jgi:cell wall-associated NlpC family hydrolase
LSASAAITQLARAAAAVATAKHQLGDPYRYKAAGPAAFDCSGLAQYAWNKAGIRLPRVASTQYHTLRVKVAWRAFRPGDLLFFWKFGHVGIYAGGGQMIHAPRSGGWVRYERLSQTWLKSAFSGAARPGA